MSPCGLGGTGTKDGGGQLRDLLVLPTALPPSAPMYLGRGKKKVERCERTEKTITKWIFFFSLLKPSNNTNFGSALHQTPPKCLAQGVS